MRFRWCAVAAAVVSAACATGMRPKPLAVSVDHRPSHVRVRTPAGVNAVPLEDYVRATILSEFAPPSGDPAMVERMLEVQAVIARTYAVSHLRRHAREGFDLCSTTHCQLYQPARLKTSTWAGAAGEAATQTTGMVLWFEKAPARAVFHADCGGHTSAAAEVWQGMAPPYLKAVKDDGPAAAAHAAWRLELDRARLTAALDRDPRTRIGKRLDDIKIVRRDRGGRALDVALRGSRNSVVRGEDLREVLARAFGPRSIRSTSFDVERSGSTFTFVGRGFGHGVGLCQAGAWARLQAGARPEQVLARYYPGTRLVVLR